MQFIDASVRGSVAGAIAGTLAVMVGAAAEDATRFEPLLHGIGGHVFYLGEVGRGNVLKLLNNSARSPTRRCCAKRWRSRIDSGSHARRWAK